MHHPSEMGLPSPWNCGCLGWLATENLQRCGDSGVSGINQAASFSIVRV